MYFEELIQRSYLKAEPPNEDEVVLLMAGCQSQIDQNLVVSKSDFDEILMANRAKDPTSEAILMTIGRSNITLGDPIWNTMLQRESVVDRYSQLTNRAAAQTLSSLEGSELGFGMGQDQPAPFGEGSFDAGDAPLPQEGFGIGEEPLPQEGFGIGEEPLPQEGYGGDASAAGVGGDSFVPEGFGFDPTELPPEGEFGFGVPETAVPGDDGFSMASDAPPPPGSEFGYGAPLTGTEGEEVLTLPTEGAEGDPGYQPMPEGDLGGFGQEGFAPQEEYGFGQEGFAPQEEPGADYVVEGATAFGAYGVQGGSDGMGFFIDDPQMHPLYECDVSEEEAESAEEAPVPGSVIGDAEAETPPPFESESSGEAPEAPLPFGAEEAGAEAPPPSEFGIPEEATEAPLPFEYGMGQETPSGLTPDDSGVGEGAGMAPSPFATGYPTEGAPAFDTMYPGEGAVPEEAPAPESHPGFGDTFDTAYQGEPAPGGFEGMPSPPPADWGVPGGEEAELPTEDGAPQGLSPSFMETPPAAAPAPAQVYDLQGYTAVTPPEETAGDFSAVDASCSSVPDTGLSGLSGLTSEASDAEVPLPGTSDEFGTPPPVEDSELQQQGGPAMYTPTEQEEPEMPAPEPEAPPQEEPETPAPEPEEDIQGMLESIKNSFDFFHSAVKQYSLATVLNSENLTPTEFCAKILEDFPEFEGQYDTSLANYPQGHDRAVLSLIQLLQLEAESAVRNFNFDRAEKCIAPVYKLIYT